jgi:hypothetical protein
MASTQGSLQCGHHLALLRLAAKLSYVGGDVDGLTCYLHRPTNCG